MAVQVNSLCEEIRSALRDYGTATTLVGPINFDDNSLEISRAEDLSAGSFLLLGDEMVEVVDSYVGSTTTLSVIRGARGSEAFEHEAGEIVRINPIYGNHEIVRALNQAQDIAFPQLYKLVDDDSTIVAKDTWEYQLPEGLERLARVEMLEPSSQSYYISRNYSYQNAGSIILEDASHWPPGTKVRLIGYGRFEPLELGEEMDEAFPNDRTALRYLVLKASADLEVDRQVAIGRRDSFIGITDSFQQSMPFMTASTAKIVQQECESLLKKCAMPRIQEYLPDPARHMMRR